MSVHLNLSDTVRMTEGKQFLSHGLEHDQKTGDLDSAAGAAGAGAQEHQHDEQCLGQLRPDIEVISRESGRRDNGSNLECGMAQGLPDISGSVCGYSK